MKTEIKVDHLGNYEANIFGRLYNEDNLELAIFEKLTTALADKYFKDYSNIEIDHKALLKQVNICLAQKIIDEYLGGQK